MDERRTSKRLNINLPAIFKNLDVDNGEEKSTVVNVSYGGIGFIVDVKVDVGQHVELDVQLEDEGVVCLQTVVVWISTDEDNAQEFAYGVRILNFGCDDAERFIRFCDLRLYNPPAQY
ncbi:MAG: PilZ domain-containing protein [Candidatus Omnitrophica bacterium]|nr:PilZ domain-containing protein [Candidatus Omnitrophota bacterium]MBU1997833.1 PilZ domain-containing protein [Candidatus Omnitrophota bacterium]